MYQRFIVKTVDESIPCENASLMTIVASLRYRRGFSVRVLAQHLDGHWTEFNFVPLG